MEPIRILVVEDDPDFQYFRIFRTFQEASAFALSITLQESTPLFTNLV